MRAKRGREDGTFRIGLRIRGPFRPLAVEFDETGTCLYIRFGDGRAAKTVEAQDEVLADYDRAGRLLGIEVVGLEGGRRASVPGSLGPKGSAPGPKFEVSLA